MQVAVVEMDLSGHALSPAQAGGQLRFAGSSIVARKQGLFRDRSAAPRREAVPHRGQSGSAQAEA